MDMNYKQAEMQTFKVAVQLEKVLEVSGLGEEKEILAEIRSLQQRIAERKFRVAVVGEFNRGKSSLINVLLGKRILPEDVLATTATINRITYGAKPRAYLAMKDGKSNTDAIPVEELASYVTKLTEESAQKAAEIQEAVVEYPTMFCYNNVDLIDTPGMNDAEEMNAVTVNRLENIDLTIVAVSALIPFGETEQKFVVQLLESPNICQIVFAITYIDMIREKEREKIVSFLKERICESVFSELNRNYHPSDKIFQKYHGIFDTLRIYAVSSYDAMEALETGDMELYEKSGYASFTTDLPDIILNGRSDLLVKNIASRLETIIDTVLEKINRQEQELDGLKQQIGALFASVSLQGLNGEVDAIISRALFDVETEGKCVARGLLESLGAASAFTPNAIQMAMLPQMQAEFKRINNDCRAKQRSIVNAVLLLLQQRGSLISEEEIERCINTSGFRSHIQAEAPGWSVRVNDIGEKYLDSGAEECYFGWSASPVSSVMNTPSNQSVLPGLIALSRESLTDCNERFREIVANLCKQMLLEAEQAAKAEEENLRSWIQKLEQGDHHMVCRQLEEMKEQCSRVVEG